jgi:hypothetical protein
MAKMIKKAQNGAKTVDTTGFQTLKKGKSGKLSPKLLLEIQKFKHQQAMDRMKLDKKNKEEEANYPKSVSTKMKNGGSLSGLKASNKRVGPVDPKGAFTKVQKKTLAGSKGKASLTKDKQLGATKMAKRGMSIKKK